MPPSTLGLCPLRPVPQGLLCQNSVFSGERGQEGESYGFKQCHCVWQQSCLLDLIRLREGAGSQAGWRSSVLHPAHPAGCSFLYLCQRLLLGEKAHFHRGTAGAL